jgi:hypothetical protein
MSMSADMMKLMLTEDPDERVGDLPDKW